MDNNENVTSLDSVVINKNDLLSVLRENRAKHNALYEAAVSGYWIKSREVLEKKRASFIEGLEESKKRFEKETSRVFEDFNEQFAKCSGQYEARNKDISFSGYESYDFYDGVRSQGGWPLTYPTNKLEDYNKVIRMIELSVHSNIKLNSNEFDCYVMNNWIWKNNFVSANTAYVDCFTGYFGSLYGTGLVLNGSVAALSGFSPQFLTIAASGCNAY